MSMTSHGRSNLPSVPNGESPQLQKPLAVPGQLLGVGTYGGPQPAIQNVSGNEFWEAMVRRKFIVILIAILGGALGYLAYTKQPDLFESSLQLQITSQAPPSLVNGDMVVQKISAPRHKSLLTSELVLSTAVKGPNGPLESLSGLKTFEGENAVGFLKKSLQVNNAGGSEDTLVLSLTGPYADELPRILDNIVNSYTTILEEDNRAVGKDSIELIEKLQKRLLDEKGAAEQRYLKLIKEVGAITQPDGKVLENPFLTRLNELLADQRQDELALQSINDRLLILNRAVDSNDDQQIRVAAIQALKSMGLDFQEKLEATVTSAASNKEALHRAEGQMNSRWAKYSEVLEERWAMGRTYGSGHPKIRQMDDRLAFLKKDLDIAVAEWEQLQQAEKEFEERTAAANSASEGMSKEEKKRETELQWIKLYATQLESDATRLDISMERRQSELETVRQDASKVSGDVVELNILQTQIDEKRDAVRIILDRLSEINVLSSNYNMVRVRLLDTPAPGVKIAPSLPKSIGYGVLIATALGIGLALLIDRADLSFRGPHEIIERLGVPVMGLIPRARSAGKKHNSGAQLIFSHQSNSLFTEAFRGLRTALFFSAGRDDIRTILCTSPSPGDGKTTTACNLAISMALAGKRVLLIDADMRRPRVHQYMGEKSSPGLNDYLKGEVTLEEAVRQISNENLFVITAGSRVKEPGEMVGHPKLAQLLSESRELYDFVIVDSPPVLAVADPCVLASQVDSVLLVLRIRKGIKMTSQKSRDVLQRAGARLLGVVVNGVDENPHYHEYGYYQSPYYYGYDYRHHGSRKKKEQINLEEFREAADGR
jgi:capsular exopolysaccharide synthesis family protein